MDRTRNSGVLEGLRVLDFGHYIAGPLTSLFLAEFGADVIHVESPDGSRWRSPANSVLQRSKRLLWLDLKTPDGHDEARRLIGSADVVIEGFRPGVMERLGLEFGSVRNDKLIWCALPGFPASDPRHKVAAWEGVLCAATGLYQRSIFEQGDPHFTPVPLASNFAAFIAAHRIVAALFTRADDHVGRRIEVSLYEACFEALGQHLEFPASRQTTARLAAWLYTSIPICPASDGTYVYFDGPVRGFQAFLDRFLPGYDLLTAEDASLQEIAERVRKLVAQRAGREWERIGQEELGSAIGLVQTERDWLRDDHAVASATVVRVQDPAFGETAQAGHPVLLSETPAIVKGPRQLRAETRADWCDPPYIDPSSERSGGMPLDSIRVLDCSTLLAGPIATRVLAQYGAEVIKVDKAGLATGDINPLSDDPSAFVGHRSVNAGKRMAFIDLACAEGQEVVQKITQGVDVVHHNFTPDAASRLGLSPQAVHALNPDAIYSTVSVHSEGGFRAGYRGHEPVAQMTTGMAARAGHGGVPRVAGILLNDNATGHLSAFGILLALLHRRRTGQGQTVNASLSRTATVHQAPYMLDHSGVAWEHASVSSNSKGLHALSRLYRTLDGWFYLAHEGANGYAMLQRIDVLEAPPAAAVSELGEWLAQQFVRLPTELCVDAATRAGFGAHSYLNLRDLMIDERATGSRLITVEEHPGIGPALGLGIPTHGSPSTLPAFLAARRPGSDTLAVLIESGFSDRIVDLLRKRVVAIGENPVVTTTAIPGFWAAQLRACPTSEVGHTTKLIRQINDAK